MDLVLVLESLGQVCRLDVGVGGGAARQLQGVDPAVALLDGVDAGFTDEQPKAKQDNGCHRQEFEHCR
jgi:hypothetical protein